MTENGSITRLTDLSDEFILRLITVGLRLGAHR